jgi:hypothetical protein
MRLRKTLKSSTRRWLAPLFIAGVTGLLLAACAPNDKVNNNAAAEINETPVPAGDASLLQGYISQTRVVGATVCYDMYDATIPGFSNTCDFGEASATSSANGLYSLTLDGFQQAQDYQLVADGGTAKSVTSSATTVEVMFAPRGAKNITPLTTMVRLALTAAAPATSDLADTIELNNSANYSASYDVDIAKSGGTYGEYLRLAKGVEVFMYAFGFTRDDTGAVTGARLLSNSATFTASYTARANHINALSDLAQELDGLANSDIFDSTSIAGAIRTAADTTLNREGFTGPLAFLDGIDRGQLLDDLEAAALAVMNEVSTGTGRKQTEESIISACSSAFAASNLANNWL